MDAILDVIIHRPPPPNIRFTFKKLVNGVPVGDPDDPDPDAGDILINCSAFVGTKGWNYLDPIAPDDLEDSQEFGCQDLAADPLDPDDMGIHEEATFKIAVIGIRVPYLVTYDLVHYNNDRADEHSGEEIARESIQVQMGMDGEGWETSSKDFTPGSKENLVLQKLAFKVPFPGFT